jgi:CRISPR-associated protein Csb2
VLRHGGVLARVEAVRVQREPFERNGARAEAFVKGTRFAKERLWHTEITFADPVAGPLLIGDGRYLGLGVMAPQHGAWRDALVFAVPATANIALGEAPALAHAARRALMALSHDSKGRVPRLFSGHEENGGQAASGRHEHVFLAVDDSDGDGRIDRLIIAAPWLCDRAMRPDWTSRRTFCEVVYRLETVRAGRLGVVALGRPVPFVGGDPLIGPARIWQSRTPYRATRHAGRRKDPAAALVQDLATECMRRSLPRPEVEILEFSAFPNGGGLFASVRLRFAVAVCGPLMLGRDSHKGGGLFVVEE